jgi:hypothetical protein
MFRHPVTLFTGDADNRQTSGESASLLQYEGTESAEVATSGDADWRKLVTDLFYDLVSILLVWVAKLQNAIKLENISNLITSPSS